MGVITAELQRRLENWRRSPNLITAAELVETAIVDAQEEEAVNAARSLLVPGSPAVPLVQRQAALLLKRVGLGSEIPAHINLQPPSFAGLWRRRTRLYPQNALAWVELALSYTIEGHLDRAERAITVALQLAPTNRHVLRSASRFFLHRKDERRAYDTIAKSEVVQHDPWLIASEVALAELIDRDSRFHKRGVAMLENQMLPRQITELAGSLATKELIAGNKKKARRFFKLSMADPNGNALAQAEWASPSFGGDLFPVSRLDSVDEAYEAKAHYLHREGQFSDVFVECEAWLENEPYSIRPYEFAAATANVLDEHEKAEELTRLGLRMRPNAPSLLNSRAYAFAGLGRTDDAEATLKKIPTGTPEWMQLVAEANRGLIAFRRGQPLEGVLHYHTAIDGFQRANLGLMALAAKTYLAREMVRAGLPESNKLIEALRNPVKNSQSSSIKKVFKNADDFHLARVMTSQRQIGLLNLNSI